jgi:Transposase DDE domain
MDADLDSLCTAVYVTADDLLPDRPTNARRALNDAEVVTLAVAQAVMGIPSDRRFLAVAAKRLGHLFPALPTQPAYFKRRRALAESIDWLAGVFAAASPGYHDDLVLLDSTPVECGRSLETVRRSALGECCGYGWSRSHSRFFWGMRLHLCCALDGTPRRAELRGADQKEREVALDLLPRCLRGGELVVCDKGYVGRGFEAAVARIGGVVVRPARKDEPAGSRPHLGRIRQRIESVFQTFKDILCLERHGARTPEGLRTRVGIRILALAASVWLNHQLGRPTRSLVAYVA